MSRNASLRIGLVGACGRGGSFQRVLDCIQGACVHAVCDVNETDLHQAALRHGASEEYVDYEAMLEQSELDAVVVGTPMPFHVPQAIAALQRGIHVLSEVPAGVSLEECRDLVVACRESKAVYMMAENYTYRKPNVLIRELAREGFFGTPYYAEGEYLHELKELNEVTRWRRKWQTGIDGVTYGTHSLGPILQWMPEDRVVSVCCAGSGHQEWRTDQDPRRHAVKPPSCHDKLCVAGNGWLLRIGPRPGRYESHLVEIEVCRSQRLARPECIGGGIPAPGMAQLA